MRRRSNLKAAPYKAPYLQDSEPATPANAGSWARSVIAGRSDRSAMGAVSALFGAGATVLLLGLTPAAAQTAAPQSAPTPTAPSPLAPAPTAPPAEAPVAPVPAAPGVAVTTGGSLDCGAEFARLDTDGDGYLSDKEAPDLNVTARIDAVTLQERGIPREDYLRICEAEFAKGSDAPEAAAVDPGAPLSGANSFTEEQARERAMSQGISTVSVLEKDAEGIWRGTGMRDGVRMALAIDFKGNVVATPAP